jgi:hypothetical protein
MFLLVNMLQILPSVPLLGIEARSVVRLSWGAKLYCTDHVPELQTVYSEQMSTDHSADDFVPWRQISSSVMTSMVVSLDILPLFQEVLLNRYSAWNTSQLTTLLLALEASHWHARSFNENANLRRNLHRLGFMPFRDQPSRWPHLLEQEVQSLTLILEAVLSMYADQSSALNSGNGQSVSASSFASSWISRFAFVSFRAWLK